MLILFCFIFYTKLHNYLLANSASQEIPPFYVNHSFITPFTSASHLSLFWAHTSGSIQVWGTSLYFISWYVYTLRGCLHLTQPLSWSTTFCWLSSTA